MSNDNINNNKKNELEIPVIKECKLKHGTIKHVEQCRKMNGCCKACKYYK